MKKVISLILCMILVLSVVPAYGANGIDVGETLTLYADVASTSYSPIGGVSRTYMWYTSNSSVVEIVSRNGFMCTIRAKAPGTATISNEQSMSYSSYDSILGTMSRWEEGFGGSWTITVNPVDPTGISLPATLSVVAESSKALTVTYTPSNASSDLLWKSSDTSVATVSGGTVYGKNPGTATVTVTTANGYSATCKVTVTKPSTVLSVVSPADGRENTDINTDIRFTYNKSIKASTYYSSVKLYDNTLKKSVSVSKSIDGKILILTPSKPLSQSHTYTATVPSGAVENMYGVKNTSQETTTFKIAPLCVESVTPANDSMAVDRDTDITIKFDGAVEKGSKWADIALKDGSGSDVEFNKSVLGNTLTVSPKTDLEYYTKYTLTVPFGAVACDGADSENDFTLSFKTLRNADVVYPPEFTFENGKLTIIAEEDTSIYYTTNGGVPLISGNLYGEPLAFDSTNIHVRAIAARNGKVSTESEYKTEKNIVSLTTFGGSSLDSLGSIAAIENGYILAGSSYSDSFGTGDLTEINGKGSQDAIIVKYDESGNIIWKKNFGGKGSDYFKSIAATESGFVTVGTSTDGSFGSGDWNGFSAKGFEDAIIVKYDTNGNIIWKKNFGGAYGNDFRSVAAADDGYIAVGYSWQDSFSSGDWSGVKGKGFEDAIIVKYNAKGNVVWKKNFGGSSWDNFRSVTATEDGCIAVGYSDSGSFGTGDWSGVSSKGAGYNAIIVKFDTNGNVKWKKNFGGNGVDEFYSVTTAKDGYIAVGYSDSSSFGTGDWNGFSAKGLRDAIIVKYDESGNVMWKKNFGGSGSNLFSFATTSKDGYIITGNASSSSINTGDWLGFGGKGNNDAIVVKYGEDGTVLDKTLFGGSDYDSFSFAIEATYGYIVGGSSSFSSFGTGDLSNFKGKGSQDAIIKYSTLSHDCDRYISSKRGKAAISGNEKVIKGDEITLPLYFTPEAETTGISIKLTYPEGISYMEGTSDFEGVYFDSAAGSLTVTGDFSADDAHIAQGERCILSRLKFKVDTTLADGDYAISIDDNETFMMDAGYDMIPFEQTEDYTFTISPVSPKAMTVTGSTEIIKETQYGAVFFPENAVTEEVIWSVSDEKIATIDQNGLLTPVKNGEVTVTVKETGSGIEKSFNVIVSGLQTYVDSFATDTGFFAKEYRPSETERILYVPEGTESLKLTLGYGAGSVTGENGVFFKNVAKTVTLESLPTELTLTKKESGYETTVYTVTVTEAPPAEIIPDIKIEDGEIILDVTAKAYGKGVLLIALYDEGTMKYATTEECNVGETRVRKGLKSESDKIKIILLDSETIAPLCKEYEVNY